MTFVLVRLASLDGASRGGSGGGYVTAGPRPLPGGVRPAAAPSAGKAGTLRARLPLERAKKTLTRLAAGTTGVVHGFAVQSSLGSYAALVAAVSGKRPSGPALGTGMADLHYRVGLDSYESAGPRRRECADVLHTTSVLLPADIWRVLREHPGCALVAAAGPRGGCMTAFPGGGCLTAMPVPAPVSGGGGVVRPSHRAAFASLLHGWLSAPLPTQALTSAMLLVPGKGDSPRWDGVLTLTIEHGHLPTRQGGDGQPGPH